MINIIKSGFAVLGLLIVLGLTACVRINKGFQGHIKDCHDAMKVRR